MSKQYQVIHKKSNVLTNGQPKLPSASTIEYGEIAINYAKGGETMSIKNANNEIVTFSSDAKILGQMPSVTDYFDGAEYDSNSKRINFKHGNTVKAYVDATNFIKDGMVDDVEITTPTGGTNSGVTCLVVTFNTDAGKEDIEIPLSLIFNPSNYYDKTAADEKFLTISAYTEDEEVVAAALNDLNDRIEQINVPQYVSDLYNDLGFVDSSHTHSQYATTAHTHTAAEVGAMATSERSNYATTAHTHTAAEVGAMAISERSNYSTTGHTHSEYASTAHTHTAEEVGAMATSERSNYSTTGHTHDYLPLAGGTVDNHVKVRENSGTTGTNKYVNVTYESIEIRSGSTGTRKIAIYPYWMDVIDDGYQLYLPKKTGTIAITDDIPTEASLTSSGFTKNALTGFTETDPTVPAWAKAENKPAYTASEVGAMATSERSNYATTAHTHTAAEVGAMATSERSNYATTAHTHTAAEVGAMATSERSNYSTTGHTHSEYLTTATTIPTEATISSSGFTKDGLTSADTAIVFFAIYGTTTYSEINQARTAGKVILAKDGANNVYTFDGETFNVGFKFTHTSHFTSDNVAHIRVIVWICNSSNEWSQERYVLADDTTISNSGYTKNAITGINVNGSAATVTNGVAEITVQGGGGSGLPAVTAADNGKILQVVNGAWALVTPSTVYSGTDVPLSSIGVDGDIYLQTS
jgi:hypothetical protein